MLEGLKVKETPLNYILAVSWRLIFKEQEILPFLRSTWYSTSVLIRAISCES